MSLLLGQLVYKMGQIEELFFEEPNERFHIRGVSRLLKIPKTTVSYTVHKLVQDGLVTTEKNVFTMFKANIDHPLYKHLKKAFLIQKIIRSGILEYIESNVYPHCIILYGSVAQGSYTSQSDIDLFVQSSAIELKTEKFATKIGHNINILFEPKLNEISFELLNNLINGEVMKGYLQLHDPQLARMQKTSASSKTRSK